LHILPNGCAVLDTPGVRELQLTDAEEGVAEVFSDLDDLSGPVPLQRLQARERTRLRHPRRT
jgi:hypothetical protein